MDLRCYESMSKNYNKQKNKMKKVKSLYKLTRDQLFVKDYYCKYCEMKDFNKYFMENHIKTCHTESGEKITLFRCKKCNLSCDMKEVEIIKHIIKFHSNEKVDKMIFF